MKNKILLIVFIILYICIGFVSCYHAVSFFSISNPVWLAIILSIAFEIGQAVVLFTILTSNVRQIMSWVLMGILTAVQVLGNVFSSHKFALINNADQIQYFTKSVLFFVQSPNPEYNYVMISYITGAILPIVALCLTGIVAKMIKGSPAETPAEHIIESPAEPEEDVFIPSN